jgi:hypothetical protein
VETFSLCDLLAASGDFFSSRRSSNNQPCFHFLFAWLCSFFNSTSLLELPARGALAKVGHGPALNLWSQWHHHKSSTVVGSTKGVFKPGDCDTLLPGFNAKSQTSSHRHPTMWSCLDLRSLAFAKLTRGTGGGQRLHLNNRPRSWVLKRWGRLSQEVRL